MPSHEGDDSATGDPLRSMGVRVRHDCLERCGGMATRESSNEGRCDALDPQPRLDAYQWTTTKWRVSLGVDNTPLSATTR